MKEDIKNSTILKKTVRPDKAKILKPSWICSTLTEFRNSGFATVCSICSLSGLVTTPSVRKSAVQHDMVVQNDMCGVQGDMGMYGHCERMRSNPANYFARSTDKVFSLFPSHLSPSHFSRRAASRIIRVVAGVKSRSTSRVGFAVAHTAPYRKFGFTLAEGATHVERQHNKRIAAFTLAEVLITLGIIGVVAAMTLPSLIQHYKKQVIETRLKKFYSTINQAIIRSEIDNDSRENWNFNDEDKIGWVNKYIVPYIKTIKVETDTGKKPVIYFADGSVLLNTSTINLSDWLFFPNGSKYNKNLYYTRADGKDSFMFFFNPTRYGTNGCQYTTKYFEPYKFGWKGTREDLFTGAYGCNTEYHGYCTALIQQNNWKIPDDYPIKF